MHEKISPPIVCLLNTLYPTLALSCLWWFFPPYFTTHYLSFRCTSVSKRVSMWSWKWVSLTAPHFSVWRDTAPLQPQVLNSSISWSHARFLASCAWRKAQSSRLWQEVISPCRTQANITSASSRWTSGISHTVQPHWLHHFLEVYHSRNALAVWTVVGFFVKHLSFFFKSNTFDRVHAVMENGCEWDKNVSRDTWE